MADSTKLLLEIRKTAQKAGEKDLVTALTNVILKTPPTIGKKDNL